MDVPIPGAEQLERDRRSTRRVAIALGLGLCALYLLSMPIRVPDGGDTFFEIELALEAHARALRPNHLFLTPVYRACVALFGWAFEPDRRWILLESVNSVAGALTAALLFLTLRRFGCCSRDAIPGVLVMALSWAHWEHSREVQAGILPELCAVTTLYLLARSTTASSVRAGDWLACAAGLALAAGVLLATNIILLAPALATGMLLGSPAGRRLRRAGSFTLAAASATLVPFLVVASRQLGSFSAHRFLEWVTHHPSEAYAGAKQFSFMNLLRACSGLGNTFCGYNAPTTVLKQWLKGLEPIAIPLGEWFWFVVGLALVFLLLLQCVARPSDPRRRAIAAMAVVACLPVLVFNVLWMGSDPKFWMPLMPFLILQACSVIAAAPPDSRRTRVHRAGAWVAVALLCACNFRFPVPTLTWPWGGRNWQRAELLAQRMSPADGVLDMSGWGSYVHAFHGQRILSPLSGIEGRGAEFRTNLEAELDQMLAAGGAIYAIDVFRSTDSASTGNWESLEIYTGLERARLLENLRARYATQQVDFDGADGAVWRITAKALR